MKKSLFLIAAVLMTAMTMNAQDLERFPWLNTNLSFHERAILLVNELTLREKVDQLGNIVSEDIVRKDANNQDYVILPHYQYWNEAIHGVARSGAATSFPESKGMSATWDRELIYDCASVTSDEARRYYLDTQKGLNYWSPTINMARDPRWGREEENYGEDPYLAGELAVPFVRGFQGADFDGTRSTQYLKLVACAKHFAANNYEAGRQSTTSFVTEKNMREYYLPAFEACVREADVKSIMAAYNAFSIDPTETDVTGRGYKDAHGGLPSPANKMLLTDILRKEWGFSGYVTSDCAAIACIHRWVKHGYFGNYTEGTMDESPAFASMHDPYDDATAEQILMEARSTALAIKAGCNSNCEFKNRSAVYQRAGVNAVTPAFQDTDPLEYVKLSEADIDSALVQILETRFALGEFEPNICPWNSGVPALETPEHQAMALKAAQESMTLLKNEGNLLPLTTNKKVALIGVYANSIMLGDYSGTPTYTTTPFEAFADKLDFVMPKNETRSCDVAAVPFDEAVVSKRGANKNDTGAGNLENTAPGDIFKYENVWFGEGVTDFVMTCGAKNTGVGQVSFILDSKDNTPFLTVGNKDTGGWTKWDTVQAKVDPAVVNGKHDLYVKFSGTQSYCGNYKSFTFSNPMNPVEEPVPAIETVGPLFLYSPTASVNDRFTDAQIERAVAVAKRADVVIFFTGTNYEKPDDHHTGTESHDRYIIALPGNQEAMLEALYAANPNTVLVLESSSSMDISWAKANVPAIMEAWYGGQAQGQAICDAIYGDINPSGKLTSTWYNSLDELPNRADEQAETQVFKRDQHGMMFYDIDKWGYTYMYYGKAKHGRQAARPLYPFGYGLSYTTFAYSDLQAPSTINSQLSTVNFTATITNTGTRDGAEVVQLYANWKGVGENGKKNRKLIGFERVEIPAGESRTVSFPVKYEQFSYYNETTHRYEVESAEVTIELAASSADIRQTATIHTDAGVAKDTYISNPATVIETYESSDRLHTNDHIYTVLGAYVGSADIFDSLPAGIYVLNGVKYFKK